MQARAPHGRAARCAHHELTPPLDIAAAASRTPPPQAAPAPPAAAARGGAASSEASGVTLEEQLRLQQFARDAERTLGSGARQESTALAPSS